MTLGMPRLRERSPAGAGPPSLLDRRRTVIITSIS
jgi:hypothetical protein